MSFISFYVDSTTGIPDLMPKSTWWMPSFLGCRAQVDAKFGQHAEGSDFSPVGARKDYGACSEKNNFSSSSSHSDDGPKQFSMSFHMTNRDSIDDKWEDTHNPTSCSSWIYLYGKFILLARCKKW